MRSWVPEAGKLRQEGLQWSAIGARLGVSGDTVRGAVRRWSEAAQGISQERVVANPPPDAAPAVLPGDGALGELPRVAIHTTRTRAEGFLVVPDLQAPFHAPGALEFCERVRREFGVAKENVLFAGDEVDNFHGKGLDKPRDPNAEHTPQQELAAAVDELRRWYAMYPTARVAISNHGTRYERRAAEAEISSQWLRLYREVIEAPPGWEWRDHWLIRASKHPFILEHGHEGKASTESKVLENGYSTVHGHFTKAQFVRVTNRLERKLWGMCVGALIDFDTYAFRYAKKYPRRPDNGCGVILDGGNIPVWVPFDG